MKKYNPTDILQVYTVCYSKIIATCVDDNAYYVILFGENPISTSQQAQEMQICMQQQNIIDEILEIDYGI